MSTPTMDIAERGRRRSLQSEGQRRAERLHEQAEAIRRARRVEPPDALDARGRQSEKERDDAHRRSLDRSREQRAGAERRESEPAPRSEPHGSRRRTHALEGMRERADRARVEQVRAQVNSKTWWDNATAGDLERARRIANAPGAGAGAREAIRSEMAAVSQRRYGTSVDGAIRYERDNPNQPPPDIRAANSSGHVLR